jgi:hypothetical protein
LVNCAPLYTIGSKAHYKNKAQGDHNVSFSLCAGFFYFAFRFVLKSNMAQFTIFITFSITCPPKGSIGINTQQQQKAEVEEFDL